MYQNPLLKLLLCIVLVFGMALAAHGAGRSGRALTAIERVSVSTTGGNANDDSAAAALSADGRFVAFVSAASNLVSGDTNQLPDVFVRDRLTGVTERVSVTSNGAQADGVSGFDTNGAPVPPGISPDGRFVVFGSNAGNLVAGDSNGVMDAFIRDRALRITERVSLGNLNDPILGFQGDGSSFSPTVSGDGRYVAFQSDAHNLVDLNGDGVPDDNNFDFDVFVRDRSARVTRILSVDAAGAQGSGGNERPYISNNGTFTLFLSRANLLHSENAQDDILIAGPGGLEGRNVATDGTPANFASGTAALAGDGRHTAFSSVGNNLIPNDANGFFDVFENFPDATSPTRLRTVLVSVSSSGVQGNNDSFSPGVNADGQWVAFGSFATNLTANRNAPNIFIHDVDTRRTARVGTTIDGQVANNGSDFPAVSGDGQYVAFQSSASNLVGGDTNARDDIFVTENPFAFRIRGRITTNGAGAAGVTVTVQNQGTGRGRFVRTAADGTFVIAGSAAGTYTVKPVQANTAFTPATRSVTLTTSDVSGVDFSAGPVFSISGVVTLNGAGVGGVLVSAGGGSATTAANGTYSLTGLPSGTYTVTPSSPSFRFTPVNRSVTINGANVTGINFTAARAYSISGVVTLNGAGLSDATVSAGGRSVLTGSNGAYNVTGLVAGTYSVVPSKRGFVFNPTSRSVTISSANVTGINFTAARAYSISGLVRTSSGAAISGVIVLAGTKSVTTGTNGEYTIVGLPAGTYSVEPSKGDFVFSPTSRSVTISSANVTGVNFTGAPVFTISGTVGTGGGGGYGGVTVRAGTRSATTSSIGTYKIFGLVAGTYSVTPSKSGLRFTPTSRAVTVGPSRTGINFTGAPAFAAAEGGSESSP